MGCHLQALLLQTLRSFRDLIATATDEAATAEAAALSRAAPPADMQIDSSATDANTSGAAEDAVPEAKDAAATDVQTAPQTQEAALAAAAVSWRAFAVANLRSFVRSYTLQLAPLAGQIDSELFPPDTVADDTRDAVLLSLYL